MSPARRFLSLFFLAALTTGSFSLIGCSRQQEGQRCVPLNGNRDCDDDLLCTAASTLRGGEDEVDRCCPAPGDPISDARCAPVTTVGDGDGDLGGDGDNAGGAGGAASGVEDGGTCKWTSDCAVPLVCGPGAICQPECQRDIDCPDGKVCNKELTCE